MSTTVGTAPLSTALGYVFQGANRALSGRPAALTGVVVLAVAGWSVASGRQILTLT
ncbi:hypothetical protein [Streptomyces niveiscabiei]|uniref:hypothetical protein n=1 Tax=Streptomyces niveiscabiei TaxID=164115 RepID=UPI000A5FE24D